MNKSASFGAIACSGKRFNTGETHKKTFLKYYSKESVYLRPILI